jgi:hypothetical protein
MRSAAVLPSPGCGARGVSARTICARLRVSGQSAASELRVTTTSSAAFACDATKIVETTKMTARVPRRFAIARDHRRIRHERAKKVRK